MSIKNYISERLLLPLSDIISGTSVHKDIKFLTKSSKWSDQQIRDFQDKKFLELVDYVSKNVPFYIDYFKNNHISSADFSSIKDIVKLPIVNKDIMRKEGIDRFTSLSYPKSKRILSRSSGSTGEPFKFYVTKDSYSMNMASKLLTWYNAGYRMGDKYMKIANSNRSDFFKKIQDKFNNCTFVPITSFDEKKIKEILDLIEKTKPKYIRSYPLPFYILSQYRINHTEYSYIPKLIFTTGATLMQSYRELIEDTFGCRIIDSYSCEGTPNISESLFDPGYNICNEYAILEVISENGDLIENGIGRVVSTDLWNYAHPFIRYDSKDLVEIHSKSNTHKSRTITSILGRECETIRTPKDQIFTVHNFVGYFSHEIENVDAYQIVKKKDGSIEIRVVINDISTPFDTQVISNHWSNELSVPVTVKIVDEIPLMKNNKRLTIVNE